MANAINLGKIDLTLLSGKRIFITGGTGFFGKNLLKFLIEQQLNPSCVTILTRNEQKFRQQNPELCAVSWLSFEQADIRELSWNHQEYDYFIHAATSVVNQADSATLFDEIVLGTKHALAFAKLAGVKSFINISSGAVYQLNTTLHGLTENSPLVTQLDNAKNTYALAKISSEHLAYLATQTSAFKVTTLRCFCFAGAYLEPSHFAIGEFVQKALNNEDIVVQAGAGIYRSYLAVTDLAQQIFEVLILATVRASSYEVYNLGSADALSLPELAHKVVAILGSNSKVTTPNLATSSVNYYVPNVDKLQGLLSSIPKSLAAIITETVDYYRELAIKTERDEISPEFDISNQSEVLARRTSLSVIVACYNDEQAIPIMAERLVAVLTKCNLDYEIIFVSNGSNDNSIQVIQELSRQNRRICGVTHSRSFEQTSQASFLNGMELSTKQACVLLDGDLQDPPEMIELFVAKWQAGYDIVYGVRHKREAPLFVQIGSKVFYRLFDKLSSVRMPHDAGDFSLIDRRAVDWMLATQEHDVLIRGMRAYVGFKHIGIKYFRPERMFGKSSNNFFKLIMWLKKGIFSYSRRPLDWMTTTGFCLVGISSLLAVVQIIIRVFEPAATPHGVTTLMLLIMFFGSFSILAISILGEYIAKIVEETKSRPIFIRDKIIKNGQVNYVFRNAQQIGKKN
ncbi:MAG: NAD-dependent epimerase/dehydratase family protein [Burkholderiales bacterium]|nr:NAD-dependent epimerase/dehydratase family protein [Burkholderiales bacterium]